MSNDGLNLFDDAATAAGGFPTVFRGYEKEAVDGYIRDLEEKLRAARAQARRAAAAPRHPAEDDEPEEVDFARLGAHATSLLTAAERQAAQLISDAHLEAQRIKAEAVEDASTRREQAEADAARLRRETTSQMGRAKADLGLRANAQVDQARQSAAAVLEAAQARAAAIQAEAERSARLVAEKAQIEADERRTQAETEANATRARLLAEEAQTLARIRQRHEETAVATAASLAEMRQAQERSSDRLAAEAEHATRLRAQAHADADELRQDARDRIAEQEADSRREASARAERLEQTHVARRDQLQREIDVLESRKAAVVAQLKALAGIAQESGQRFGSPTQIDAAASISGDETPATEAPSTP